MQVVFHDVLLRRSLLAPFSIRSLPCASAKSKMKEGAHSMLARWVLVISSISKGMLFKSPALCCMATGDVPLPVRYRRGCPHTPAFALSTRDLPVPDQREPMCHTNPSYSVNRMSGEPKLSRQIASAVSIPGLSIKIVFQSFCHLASDPLPFVLRLMFSSPGIGTVVSRPSLVNTRLLYTNELSACQPHWNGTSMGFLFWDASPTQART